MTPEREAEIRAFASTTTVIPLASIGPGNRVVLAPHENFEDLQEAISLAFEAVQELLEALDTEREKNKNAVAWIQRERATVARLREALEDRVIWYLPIQVDPCQWADMQGCELCGARSEVGEHLVHRGGCVLALHLEDETP